MLPLLLALALSSTLGPAPCGPEEPPAIFAHMTFEEARAAAAKADKLLVLDAMTSWCGPCKQMDGTTWIDPELVRWMRANTIAIQLDMDLFVDLKNELAISAFPTILTFDETGERDRIVGYRDAAAMGDWLKLVHSGSTELERILAKLEARTWTNSIEDLQARIHWAGELFYVKGYADAKRLLFEAWEAAPAASFDRANLRGSLGDLARNDSASRTAIEGLRAGLVATGNPAKLPGTSSQLADWIHLSVALGDDTGLDAWVLGRNARGEGAVARQFGGVLYPLLLNSGHWRSAGISLVDPLGRFERSGANLSYFDGLSAGGGASMGGMTPAMPIGTTPRKAMPIQPEPVKPEPVEASAPADETPAAKPKVFSMPAMPMIGAGAKVSADSDETGVLIRAQYRWDASNAYAALLAADRQDEATALGELVLGYENSPKTRIALVARAL